MEKNLAYQEYNLCFFYNGKSEIFLLSHNPELTLLYLNNLKNIKEIQVLKPALKIDEAYFLLQRIRERYDHNPFESNYYFISRAVNRFKNYFNIVNDLFKGFVQPQNQIINIKNYASNQLTRLCLINDKQPIELKTDRIELENIVLKDKLLYLPHGKDVENVISILEGRKLFIQEIYQGIRELELNINGNIEDILHWLYLQNIIEIQPSITYVDDKTLECQRCGQRDRIQPMECHVCGKECSYCENCVAMGEARCCRPIYSSPKSKDTTSNHLNQLPHEDLFDKDENIILTKAQKDAYDELCAFINSNRQRALNYAVCGAGKTEIVFGAIQKALLKGQKVLFAIPRKDVVLELYPRLNKYFSQYNILPLYGGCPKKYSQSSLIIATTHQTLRYQEAFDLIILDEVDAFPYKGSKMLYFAVERAKKKSGKIIYMTATPDKRLLYQSNKKGWSKVIISARHHGHPLPVPEIIVERPKDKGDGTHGSNLAKNKALISETIWEIIKESVLKEKVQLFIFVPSINLAEEVCKIISAQIEERDIGPGEWVQFSHSKDPQREQKRQGFSKGDFPIFITTTIMERGITVPRSNVLVLYAHWEKIFDQGTLIQMAGRAGRSKEYPKGRVIFLGEKITDSMADARKIIIELNNQAIKKGYIKRDI